MPGLFPAQHVLQQTFGSQRLTGEARSVPASSRATPRQARPELYGAAYSAVDDPKNKLSAEAQKEFDKASSAAKAKKGQIEMYSGGFYAAATFGGLLACVSVPVESYVDSYMACMERS
jgi:solute carrier family 25 (mitochondrial phosphate transporter), member 3